MGAPLQRWIHVSPSLAVNALTEEHKDQLSMDEKQQRTSKIDPQSTRFQQPMYMTQEVYHIIANVNEKQRYDGVKTSVLGEHL
jgi:5,10-methylene-tetrahydrofolate dehydrogenase/methenyl tetrahydrofolate cyclohydrolase